MSHTPLLRVLFALLCVSLSEAARSDPPDPVPPGADLSRPDRRAAEPSPAGGQLGEPAPLSEWLDGLAGAVEALRAGDAAAALRASRQAVAARPSGDAGGRGRLLLGLALLRSGADGVEALEAARAELADPRLRAWVAVAQAEALVAAGRRREASSLLGDLAGHAPAPPAARARAAALAAAPTQEPSGPPTSPEARTSSAESLVAAARPREALELLDEPERIASATAEALRGLALLALGRRPEAEASARRALASAGPPAAAAAELVLARVAARDGRSREAADRYRRLARYRGPVPGLPRARRDSLADDAAFLAAWLPYDAGRFAEAARSLAAFVRERPGSPRVEDARWFEAWSLVRAGKVDRARLALRGLVPGPLEARALYWQGRLAEAPAVQRRLFRRARAAAGPEGWYGQLAAARLRALGAPVARWDLRAGPPPGDGPGAGPAGRALAGAAELIGAGLADGARAELEALAASPAARRSAARLAQLASAAGEADLALAVARDHLGTSRRSLRLAHPEPLQDRLPRTCAAAGVDRDVVLALLRRESGFRRGPRSAAGAVGAFQLLPSTAERLGTAAGLSGAGAAALDDPAAALPLGVVYLGLLSDRFGHPAAALAAYNAGPAAAAGWGAALAGLPLDEWAEDLPFRETRRYVKAVLADAGVYRWLRGEADLAIDGLVPVPAPAEGAAF
jgi:soluble lytic murein transglycosylase